MFQKFVIHLTRPLCTHDPNAYGWYCKDQKETARPGITLVVYCQTCQAHLEVPPEDFIAEIVVAETRPASHEPALGTPRRFEFSLMDKKFLKGLKIRVDPD